MMNQKRFTRTRLSLLLPLLLLIGVAPLAAPQASAQSKSPQKKGSAQPGKKPKATEPSATPAAAVAADPASEEALKASLDELARDKQLAASERLARLEALVAANPGASAQRTRALDNLARARAALGDEKLRAGDSVGGIELFRRAVDEAPLDVTDASDKSDRLFANVVSQLPANLYVLGHPEAAFELARRIESRITTNPMRLLALAAFYLGVERADEAERLAASAEMGPTSSSSGTEPGRGRRASSVVRSKVTVT